MIKKRTDYHRNHYAENREKRCDQKQISRDDFDLATSYWRKMLVFGRECPFLISRVPSSIVKRARINYERMLEKEYGSECVESFRNVSTTDVA